MTYNLLYIDDEAAAETLKDGFNTTGQIKVNTVTPLPFEEQVEYLLAHQNEFDGLILDLRLDENPIKGRQLYYTATSLATTIRSMAGDNQWKKEFPIILFTTKPNIEKLYQTTVNDHGLFDLKIVKDDITNELLQHRIHSIIDAYHTIAQSGSEINKILNLSDTDFLDKRVFADTLRPKSAVFRYATYTLSELILVPGPLIDEEYLAARLGVDIEKSPAWGHLKEALHECCYTGIFSSAWNRWWMYSINQWWENKIAPDPLASLDAHERIDLLKKQTGLDKLVAAEPIAKAVSYRYWTVCQGYHRPLDAREGLRINARDPLDWQEPLYMSLDAALERVKREEGLRIHPLERERFDLIKKSVLGI